MGGRGDQSQDKSSRLAEKKQHKEKMRRKEGLEKEEKRKENFPLLLDSKNTRREDRNHQNLMN